MIVHSPGDVEEGVPPYQGSLVARQRIESYADLVASERISTAVIERLGLDLDPSTVQDKIKAYAVPDTILLRAAVTDPDPELARDIADAVGEVFSDAVANIETFDPGHQPAVRVSVWERAKLPTNPVAPHPAGNIALGVTSGLLASLAAVFLRRRIDAGVSGSDDASEITGFPALATIAFDADAARRPLVVQLGPHSSRAEAFRRLRANLQFVDVDAAPRSMVVTSSTAGEGRTSTACNLAITLAQAGSKVVLVEGDLRRPSFADYLGVESAAGLTSVLIGAAGIDDVLWPWGEGRVGDGRLEVLPSGPVPPNPSELLGSRGMADLLATLAARFDFVIVDAPPLLSVTDAAVIAAQVDGALLVARVGRTRREQLARAVGALRSVDARVLGLVLSMVPAAGPSVHHHGDTFNDDNHSLVARGRHSRVGGAVVPSTGVASTSLTGLAQAIPLGGWRDMDRRRLGAGGSPVPPVSPGQLVPVRGPASHGSSDGAPSGASPLPTDVSDVSGKPATTSENLF